MSVLSAPVSRPFPLPQARKPRGRSRLSNGVAILDGIDGRSTLGRRYRDVVASVVADLGGLDQISETKLSLVRRFAASTCLAEQLEARLVNGETIDVTAHTQLCSSLVRLAQRIGLSRHAKLVPSVAEYLTPIGVRK